LCAAKQDHGFAGSLSQVLHNLNDSKDVVYISSQVDITRDADGRVEGVDAQASM
jgi:hypothetical protein